jgi:hypothetical protein
VIEGHDDDDQTANDVDAVDTVRPACGRCRARGGRSRGVFEHGHGGVDINIPPFSNVGCLDAET